MIRNYASRNFNKEYQSDSLSDTERSERMSRIRSSNTKLENEFIAALNINTRKKFVVNDVLVFGKPDIVFRKQRLCIFLDSDFWYGWQYPRWKRLLKNDFWRLKIERNRRRDRRVTQTLRRKGWIVLRFWEHNIKKDGQLCVRRVLEALECIPK